MSRKTFINGKQKSSMEIDPGMRFKYFFINVILVFFYLPSSGTDSCVGTAGMVQTPTLDGALLSSSRAGADLGRTPDSRL